VTFFLNRCYHVTKKTSEIYLQYQKRPSYIVGHLSMYDYSVFWTKASENLKATQLCFDNGLYNACANRAYYAMYHAAIAILIAKGFPPTQKQIDHGWVQSTFARELINRRKIMPNALKAYLSDAQIFRNNADYRDIMISQKTANRQVRKSQEFIDKIEMELSK